MHVCVRVSNLLALELQTVVSCWGLNSGPLEKQSVLLTAEPNLQTYITDFNIVTLEARVDLLPTLQMNLSKSGAGNSAACE